MVASLKQIDELAIAFGDRVDCLLACRPLAPPRDQRIPVARDAACLPVHCVRRISKCATIYVPSWLKPVVSNATLREQRPPPTAETRREKHYRYLRRDNAAAALLAYERCLLRALCLRVPTPR